MRGTNTAHSDTFLFEPVHCFSILLSLVQSVDLCCLWRRVLLAHYVDHFTRDSVSLEAGLDLVDAGLVADCLPGRRVACRTLTISRVVFLFELVRACTDLKHGGSLFYDRLGSWDAGHVGEMWRHSMRDPSLLHLCHTRGRTNDLLRPPKRFSRTISGGVGAIRGAERVP